MAVPARLAPRTTSPRGIIRWHAYDAQNAEAAQIILANPARYGGWEALPVRWAVLIMKGRRGN